MADQFHESVTKQLDAWKERISRIEEQAKDASTFDKLELLARAERLRTRSREVERHLDLLKETDSEREADDIRKEIEAVTNDLTSMLEQARHESRKRTGR